MPYVKVGSENGADIEIRYRDHGAGWTFRDEVNSALLEFLRR
jgi:hypothetical protein